MNIQSVVVDPAAPSPLSRRDLRSVTAEAERRLLVSLAGRLPGWIGPDHLTALGLASMAGAGLCYWLVPQSPLALLGVNLFLFLNWFGDSLDGTVARVRQRQRPRYGFYVDHLVDALGAIFLLAGLALSGLGTKAAATALLVAYLLLQIHIALKAHATGVFQIAFAGVGGTEARILMGAMNLVLLIWPGSPAPIVTPLLWVLAAGLGTLVAFDGVRTGRALDGEERRQWTDGGGGH